MTATLKLTRHIGGVAYATSKWPVTIDGNVVDSIDRSQTLELPVGPGHHALRLGSKRHPSPKQSFLASDGEVVSFRCRRLYTLGAWVVALFKARPMDLDSSGVGVVPNKQTLLISLKGCATRETLVVIGPCFQVK